MWEVTDKKDDRCRRQCKNKTKKARGEKKNKKTQALFYYKDLYKAYMPTHRHTLTTYISINHISLHDKP